MATLQSTWEVCICMRTQQHQTHTLGKLGARRPGSEADRHARPRRYQPCSKNPNPVSPSSGYPGASQVLGQQASLLGGP